ncbi:DUF3515 domain-containing protein [Blastococcus jejuensis]|uniref:DUF3515 domain-containing protein n=1 Tax=Blastococcus jejuensis TaxID=351224 RepID=A0ABP6PCY7_9ACTN
MPVVVAVVVLVNVLGGSSGDDPPARVDASTPQRAELPVLPLEVPPVTPEADASCPALMEQLPLELAGEQSRRVRSDSPFAYAWGDPAVTLICGVDRPAGFAPDSALYQINGVFWLVDDSDPDTTVWTAVDRPVYVELRVPATIDSGPATVLSTTIAATLAYQEPDPSP